MLAVPEAWKALPSQELHGFWRAALPKRTEEPQELRVGEEEKPREALPPEAMADGSGLMMHISRPEALRDQEPFQVPEDRVHGLTGLSKKARPKHSVHSAMASVQASVHSTQKHGGH